MYSLCLRKIFSCDLTKGFICHIHEAWECHVDMLSSLLSPSLTVGALCDVLILSHSFRK